jgi:hypothetical protein
LEVSVTLSNTFTKQLRKLGAHLGVTPSISTDPKQTDTVFVALASIPSRVSSLQQVVESLLPQVTAMGVYLNGYDSVPEFLSHPKIQVVRSQKHGDVRDNGKFFFLEKSNADFYATVDDDIFYPDDYIATLVQQQKRLGGTHAVGVHGSIYPKPVRKLLANRHLWHFSHASTSLNPVDMIGTGTLLFNQRYWKLRYSEFGKPGMADVWFAVAAAKRGFGLWSVPRSENWMHALELEEEGNLFREGKFDDSVQVQALEESEIGSTRESLLERVVRSSSVASNFSLHGAAELAYASFNVGLPPIAVERLKLFRGAFVAHKDEAKIEPILGEGVEIGDYVEHLLQLAAGIRNPAQANFETNYLTALKSAPNGALGAFQMRDKEYLENKLV